MSGILLLALLALQDDRINAGANCEYCHGDPELMAAAGIASHGGFGFGTIDTNGVDEMFAELDLRWIESQHFEIGFGLPPYKIDPKEKQKIRAELERLALVLPDVKPRTKILDPFLRVHLYAQRFEDTYAQFLELMRVTQDDFPVDSTGWVIGTPYWGEGPHAGQQGKYEVLVLPGAAQQETFLLDQFGLRMRHTQKWNVRVTDSLISVTNLTEENIRGDRRLHGHLVFNVVHNLVDGYKHYSYDTPPYLKEGLAHHLERLLTPEYNTFSFSEGGLADMINKADWDDPVKKLIVKEELPRLAELIALDTFAEFVAEHHLAVWSLTTFLLERYPEEYAELFARLHGRKGPDGLPDSTDLRDVHRDAFRELFGKSYAEVDVEWREWALLR